MTVFGKAFAIETVRGCSRSCRFCLLRHISQPKRERSLEKVESIIEEGIRYTPVRRVSLIGASIFDYSFLEDVCEFIVSRGLELVLPSIRPESVTERLANLLVRGKQRTVTIAPDAASPHAQKITNKKMEEAVIIDAVKILLRCGVNRLKLYFVIGLPGENADDIIAIADMSKKIANIGYGPKAIHLSINPLIPKPHTPFQWERTPSVTYVRQSLKMLEKRLKGYNRFVIDSLDPRHAQIQAFLSLGGREIGKVIELAARYGGGLGAWRRSLKECRVSLESYTQAKNIEESLPWDKINVGVSRRYLMTEVESYRKDIRSV